MKYRFVKTQENGDATSNYNIEGIFPVRFEDFFRDIVKQEDSFRIEFASTNAAFGGWCGKRFEINKSNEDGKWYASEDHAKWFDEIKDLPVVKCWANGGWGQMTYFVTFDEKAIEKMEQPMKLTELKPCPFCGGEAVIEPHKSRKGYEATIQCNGGCILYMNTITYDTEEEAVETVTNAWNRRADDEQRETD